MAALTTMNTTKTCSLMATKKLVVMDEALLKALPAVDPAAAAAAAMRLDWASEVLMAIYTRTMAGGGTRVSLLHHLGCRPMGVIPGLLGTFLALEVTEHQPAEGRRLEVATEPEPSYNDIIET